MRGGPSSFGFPPLLVVLPLLAACSPDFGEEIAEAIAQVLIVAMVISVIFMIIGAILVLGQLLVVVVNFVRPNIVTMVLGYVLGGFTVLGLADDTIEEFFPEPPAAPAPTESSALVTVGPATPEPGLTMSGLLWQLAWSAALLGSARYAQVKRRRPALARDDPPAAGRSAPEADTPAP